MGRLGRKWKGTVYIGGGVSRMDGIHGDLILGHVRVYREGFVWYE